MRRFLMAALAAALLGAAATAQPDPKFPRGAKPTPKARIAASPQFRPKAQLAAAPQFAMLPEKLDYWGNNLYGVCVTSERASAFGAWSKYCGTPVFIPAAEVIRWATAHGVRDGAWAEQVLSMLQKDGFRVGDKVYKGGPFAYVDYRDTAALKQALTTGPVTIAIAADALPSTAGNKQGWYAVGAKGQHRTDHEVGLLGYGPAKWCFEQLKVPLPAGIDPDKEMWLVFTWATVGVVDTPWLLDTCVESWVSVPTIDGMVPNVPSDPPVAVLAANPDTVAVGAYSVLVWSTANAQVVTLDGKPVPPNGTLVVTPANTTTYTLLATGAGGKASSTATVTVGGGPPTPGQPFEVVIRGNERIGIDPVSRTVTIPPGWSLFGPNGDGYGAALAAAGFKIDPAVLVADLAAIAAAYASGNYVALAVAVAKLVADLTAKGPPPAAAPPPAVVPQPMPSVRPAPPRRPLLFPNRPRPFRGAIGLAW